MEIVQADDPRSALKAAEVLRSGGVILYPTDTLYALGADALSDDSVAKIYAIKGRDAQKPMHAIVADMDAATQYAEMNDAAQKLADAFLPGPLTLVFKKKPDIDSRFMCGLSTIGLRVPNNQFCLALAREFGRPFTATSANRSGQLPQRTISEVVVQLGDAANLVDLAIDVGELPERLPSTVVDVSTDVPSIIREGAISRAAIDAASGL